MRWPCKLAGGTWPAETMSACLRQRENEAWNRGHLREQSEEMWGKHVRAAGRGWLTGRMEPGGPGSMRTSEKSQKGKLHQKRTRQIIMDEERKAWDKVFSALLGQAEMWRLPGRGVVGILKHLWVVGLAVVEVHSSLEDQSSMQKGGTYLGTFWSWYLTWKDCVSSALANSCCVIFSS